MKRSGKIVPKQNKNKIGAEVNGLAEARAKDWAVRVKPQGRKKVKIPATTGPKESLFVWVGKIVLKEKTFKKLRERIRVIIETTSPVTPIF